MKAVIQPWLCEKCNRASATEYEEGTDAYDVRNSIWLDHAHLEPACAIKWGISYVRVNFGKDS